MKKLKILVVVVNYNQKRLTERCIESINRSSVGVDIFLVDNASMEGGIEEVKKMYDNVILHKSTMNLGFSGANNIGIQYAIEHEYTYVMLLNNDTVIDGRLIEELCVKCTNECVVTPCMYYYDKPEVIWYAGGMIDKVRGGVIHKHQNEVIEKLSEEYCDFVTGCCFMMTVSTAEKVGYLRDEYFMYCEDLDYSIRLAQYSIHIKFVPSAKLWHKVGSASGSEISAICVYYGTRNRLDIVNKNSEIFAWTAMPYTYVTRMVKYIIYRVRKIPSAKLFIRAIQDYRNGKMGRSLL